MATAVYAHFAEAHRFADKNTNFENTKYKMLKLIN